jgi:CubicO group peptidase (beta-lactamase class C family)
VPGESYDYSNVGVTLAAYIVERISGVPFDEYTESHVFAPLAMHTSTWHTEEISEDTATPYFWSGTFDPQPRWGYPDWPAGHLYTTASELARFLAAFVRGGELDGVRILEEGSVAEARREQLSPSADAESGQGLIWYAKNDGTLLGHDGEDDGWASQMFFRLSDGVGVILLCNGSRETIAQETALERIEERLFADAASL